MKRTLVALAMAWLGGSVIAVAAAPVTEDFESGYADGEPVRVYADWFFKDANDDPATDDGAGVNDGWGVGPGDRAFTWVAHPFDWNDPKLVSVAFGGDWKTDAAGKLDDDRAGWSISNEDDSSDNIFGVQMDPGGQGESALNIECYWDGQNVGDDAGRASIVALPKLEGGTWYRLRAKFTKLTATSAKVEVTFVELDDSGDPTGDETKGSIADTSQLSDTGGEAVPNQRYFAAETVWPVFKNYLAATAGFDNAYFQIEKGDGAETAEPEPEPDPKPEPEPEPEPEPKPDPKPEPEPDEDPFS